MKQARDEKMKRRRLLSGVSAILLLIPTSGAAQPAGPTPPRPAGAAESPAPAACAAERAALQAERAQISGAIGDIALGKSRRKRKVSGGEVAAGVAGTAASVLLPFGVGALLGAGARAAAKGSRKKRPAPRQPDVPAMIDRVNAIDARLASIEGCA